MKKKNQFHQLLEKELLIHSKELYPFKEPVVMFLKGKKKKKVASSLKLWKLIDAERINYISFSKEESKKFIEKKKAIPVMVSD